MNCKKIKISMSEYLDNALGEQDKKLIEQHLNDCAECAKEYAVVKKTRHVLSALGKQNAPLNFENKVMGRIKNGNFASNPLESFFATAKTSLIAAVFIFGIIVTFSFFTVSTETCPNNIDNVEAMNNYVLKDNAFAKQSKISDAKIVQAMLS
jgi:mycothiol system anti-sigma-R factor